MIIHLYKSFSKDLTAHPEIYILKNCNYIALLMDKMASNRVELSKKMIILKNDLKLKAKELSQENFINLIITNEEIKNINFDSPIDDEDFEIINKYLLEKNNLQIIQKIKNSKNYYYIESLEFYLKESQLSVILNKTLEIIIISKAFEPYSDNEILENFSNTNLFSEILKEVEGA
ncbi:hypothetical protein [Cetobacterium somerae]|uniref:hypothetical protein n=1 Tax=Cetobacterium TaxID=180162 RepID=UPI0038921FE0